jgi:hypothetical protein
VPGQSAPSRPSTGLPTAAPLAPPPASPRDDRAPSLDPVVPPGFSSHEGDRSDPALRATEGRDATLDDGHAPINGGHALDGGQAAVSGGHVPMNGGPMPVNGGPASMHGGPAHVNGAAPLNGNPDRTGQCTAPQLRRFIKSRPYVPMHELRRRFGIDGGDDDVTSVRLEPGWVYIGLPSREGTLLGDLLRAGEIGYELSLDPRSPIVIGVYPMRPIPRG